MATVSVVTVREAAELIILKREPVVADYQSAEI
jgi:hypothetical protein